MFMFMFMYAIFLPCYTLIALRRKQDLHAPPRQETRPYLRRVIERRIQAEAIPKKTRESRPTSGYILLTCYYWKSRCGV